MINRFSLRQIINNSSNLYEDVFRKRNIKFVNQFNTARFYQKDDLFDSLEIREHTWSFGDRYYKLSEKYYGDPRDWWLIAKFNNKPTDSHNKYGDIILIPFPLDKAIEYLRG